MLSFQSKDSTMNALSPSTETRPLNCAAGEKRAASGVCCGVSVGSKWLPGLNVWRNGEG